MEATGDHRQALFETSYRDRQSTLHHASYLRMSKVLLALRVIEEAGIDLEEKEILDYGFGSGTFFYYCPGSARLYGVEIDAENVEAVARIHAEQHATVELGVVTVDDWERHALLGRQYDVILCSHVLEHLDDPPGFLRVMRRCLKPDGSFVGLVPINERAANPRHLHTVDEALVEEWTDAADLQLTLYVEADPWLYWAQPLYTSEQMGGLRHRLSQVVSMMLGLPATAMGANAWQRTSSVFGLLTRSKPTQAAFVLRRST